MSESRVHSPSESDEFVSVSYVAVRPRKRDFVRVLFGRYVPSVVREARLTVAGVNRELKASWSSEAIAAEFLKPSPLAERLGEPGVYPVRKRES